MEMTPLAYDSAVDGIRAGIRRAKGVALAEEEIIDSTPLWLTGDPDQPCLSFDSLDFLELVAFLEERYGWVLPESAIDVNECQTVGDLALMVVKNVHGEV
jgi:hypothetical protein